MVRARVSTRVGLGLGLLKLLYTKPYVNYAPDGHVYVARTLLRV